MENKHGNARLTDAEIAEIVALRDSIKITPERLAQIYGVTSSYVRKLHKGYGRAKTLITGE